MKAQKKSQNLESLKTMSDAHAYPHEPTGVETRKLGFWVFLSTEILFFGTLITTFLIFKGRDFPGIKLTDVYDIPFTSVSSFVLLMSSLTMVLAHNALETNDQEKTRVWLLAVSYTHLTLPTSTTV